MNDNETYHVFLGGTCNESTWREKLLKLLDPHVKAFNPVVPDWTSECQKKEIEVRETAWFNLYVITPKMTGVYSVAEVVDDSNKRPSKTIFCLLEEDDRAAFEPHQLKSLKMVRRLVASNGAYFFDALDSVADFLNQVVSTDQ